MTTRTGPNPGTLTADIVGVSVGPLRHVVDARWLMAYAAALGETDPRYFDTLAVGGPLAHPLFPVCFEWPVALALRDRTVASALQPLGVHASHRLVLHRPPRAGDSLRTTGTIVAVAPRRSGTLVTTRFETVDAGAHPVCTTDYGSIYRGIGAEAAERDGHARTKKSAPRPVVWQEGVDVAANAAHLYTECARIWNPIHTDVAIARSAGLPGPILHGTATIAMAISRVVARELDGDPTRVGEIRVRFSGMVPLPSWFEVRGLGREAGDLIFDAVASDRSPILSQGVVTPCDR